MGLGFCMQVLEVIVIYGFRLIGAFAVGIGNRDRCWKVGLESFLMTVTRGACMHI